MKLKRSLPIILFVLLCLILGYISGDVTADAIPGWYQGLKKPHFNPPDWVFAPVWTLLYIMMGWAAGRIYNSGFEKQEVKYALSAFMIQLFLNVLWSQLFFGMKDPFLALIDIFLLLAAISWTMIRFKNIDKTSAYLLYPYLAWVCFATILNASIVWLN
ncbi:TspO/MBR family protein [Balneola sp. MJW-20]|uniref:TspO/MBR family protein n=1 Tax=Gracilimonas aurantiaca TaxID=3234185 RepID=UPI0034677E61